MSETSNKTKLCVPSASITVRRSREWCYCQNTTACSRCRWRFWTRVILELRLESRRRRSRAALAGMATNALYGLRCLKWLLLSFQAHRCPRQCQHRRPLARLRRHPGETGHSSPCLTTCTRHIHQSSISELFSRPCRADERRHPRPSPKSGLGGSAQAAAHLPAAAAGGIVPRALMQPELLSGGRLHGSGRRRESIESVQ